jgi:F0F1-type ATP synthase assembly protein I
VERVDLRERRELNNGFGDALSRAFELAATPAIFAGLGWLIDRQVGTSPLFLLILFFLAIIGVGYMTWFRYEEEMREHEADAVWSRRRARSQAAARDLSA